MSNFGDFSVGLTEVIKWSDAAYSIGRLLVLFIIVFGLLYYLGRLTRETHKLKRPSRFETDLRSYAQGLVILIAFLSIAAVIAPALKPEILNNALSTLVLLGFVEFALICLIILSVYVYSKFLEGENKTKIFWKFLTTTIIHGLSLGLILSVIFVMLALIVPILVAKYAQQQQTYVYLSVLFVFLLLIVYPILSGRFSQPPEHKVSVYLSGSNEPLEDMVLYQTTEVDYRFKKGDTEIVIPISKVQKIVYKTSQKETQTAPSDERVMV